MIRKRVAQSLRRWLGVGTLPPPPVSNERERHEMEDALRCQEAKEWGVILRFQQQSAELRRSLAGMTKERR